MVKDRNVMSGIPSLVIVNVKLLNQAYNAVDVVNSQSFLSNYRNK